MYRNNDTTTRMFLTTAVVAAVAALLAGPASAFVMDVEGGGGNGTATVAAQQQQVQPGTIPYLSHGVGVDQSQFQGATLTEFDPAIRTAVQAHQSSASDRAQAQQGPIPYLSHGIGVDQSLYQGEPSLGLTGDSPITRGEVFQAANNTASLSSGSDVNWTWVGFGAGMAALLAAAMGALYLSARNRDRVALP